MNHKTVTILIPPALSNSSCSHPRYATGLPISWGSVTEATFVLLLTVGICGGNILVIVVINTRRYSKYIHSQPRYLLTCLASNDLAVGLLVTSVAFLPALLRCWPYSDIICQIQALLRGALTQQSAMILIYMAMDRYTCMLHPVKYHKHASRKGCMCLISLTLISCLSVFATLVLPRGGYYHNGTGLAACDPFYPRPSFRILAACMFYFPTTMMLMYCYGSAFHVNRLRLRRSVVSSIVTAPNEFSGSAMERMVLNERRLSTVASRTMAAMSLGFIVMVTPWTIQEVVAACTGSKLPPSLDFTITWLALSNSFWNPFLYWLLNSNFRRISRELFLTKILGREARKHPPHMAATYLPHVCCPSGLASTSKPDVEGEAGGLSEKHWGDILERTVSSGSLQALQRVYPPPAHSMSLPHSYSMSLGPRHTMSLMSSPPQYPRVHQCAVPGH